ncbi:MAG: type II/IV secretion system ATPase subunit [Flavobacterium sp.]|uniref:type II/IV secretion system ATPase subunit n=1 Tax=Flavobacterium sp. TaxID=239 RepID=UPI002622DD17|nr:type II/IV secretion system ATPase subunit [Flavobacterium sp.]MDD5149128.1 type II/IV secretion system ATPase subunit [Flavobacterium sp.]
MEEKNNLLINTSPAIPRLLRIQDKTKANIRYTLISPYASAHIFWDKENSEMVYGIEEPILDEKEKEILEKIEAGMKEIINLNVVVEKSQDSLINYIDKTARMLIDEIGLDISENTYKKVFYYLFRDFIGLNKIEPLMRDYFIEDIECNGINTPVYIIHRLYRSLKTNLRFNSIDELASFVEKLAQRASRYISYASPILDGTLPDGSRVNATYTTDITSKGPTFTIRKFTKIPWTPTQLIASNTLSPEMMAYFWMLIQYKSNILITGGTASGKTTLLNAISFFIPPESRVVSIEDTRELNLLRENWLPSVARTAIGLGKFGEIDLYSLLKNSFRQNPDYVIVGEVRGQEAYVLFQGMASGHASISTLHADSVDTVIKRLETPPIELSPTLLNILDAVAVMSHVVANKQETRRLREVTEIVNVSPDGEAITNTPFSWNPAEDKFYFKKSSKTFEKISERYGISNEKIMYDFSRRVRLLYELTKRKIFDAHMVQKIINDFYKNPDGLLQSMGIQ